MEPFSALLAPYEGIPGGFPLKGQLWCFLGWTDGWPNSGVAGDSRRYEVHVTLLQSVGTRREKHEYIVGCRYNTVEYIMVFYKPLQLQRQNINQTMYSQKTPQISPPRESYGVSIVRFSGTMKAISNWPFHANGICKLEPELRPVLWNFNACGICY